MGSGRGNSQETNLSNQAQAASTKAAEVNPLQQAQQASIQKFWGDRDAGKDVGQISYLSPYYNLFNSSKNANQNYAGDGLLSDNAMAGGNGRMLGLIGKQLQDRKEQQASGDLYNASNEAYRDSVNTGMGIANADTQQRLELANQANQRYSTYLNRPRKPSIWEQLLGGAMGAASSFATGGMSSLMGSVGHAGAAGH